LSRLPIWTACAVPAAPKALRCCARILVGRDNAR
jgi:hypothetical protein